MRGWFSCIPNRTALAGVIFCFSLAGCHSHYVQTTLINQGTTTVKNVEVDYPSASFGVSSLSPGAHFNYRFQIQGSGHMQLIFVDSAGHSHTLPGPYVAENQEGTLEIDINGNSYQNWLVQLKPEVTAPKE